MEDNTILLNSKQILTKRFTADVKGYDPDEVDEFLDQIVSDYGAFEAYYADSKNYIVDLETQLRKARESINKLEVDNARLNKRLAGIKDSDTVSSENIDLLQRINILEKELYRLGVDPRKL